MSCCPWGLAGTAGAMNCNGLFFGRSCECQQTVDLELAVLGCVCCCKCCAGSCERVTSTVHGKHMSCCESVAARGEQGG